MALASVSEAEMKSARLVVGGYRNDVRPRVYHCQCRHAVEDIVAVVRFVVLEAHWRCALVVCYCSWQVEGWYSTFLFEDRYPYSW